MIRLLSLKAGRAVWSKQATTHEPNPYSHLEADRQPGTSMLFGVYWTIKNVRPMNDFQNSFPRLQLEGGEAVEASPTLLSPTLALLSPSRDSMRQCWILERGSGNTAIDG